MTAPDNVPHLPEDLALVRVVTASHVLARRLRDEAIVLNMRTEQYAGFDSVGAAFWEAATEAPSLADAAFKLGAAFPDVEPDRIEADLIAFVEGVRTRGLVDIVTSPAR
jgi:Coenzyme PQQ synthesis protein D (PqqD)